MPPKSTPLTQAAVRRMIKESVDAAIAAERARYASAGNDARGSGPVRGQDAAPVVRDCTFARFMKCNPTVFHGIEGAIKLRRWFEKTESVFRISECAEGKKVKFAAATLQGPALTWWNSKIATMEFFPMEEIQRMGHELWNLRVKEYNIVAYTQRFNELALMCPRMVEPESVKVDAYIWGLSENIKGEVTCSRPTNLNEAVCMAHKLMKQKSQAKDERILEGKKRKWENFQSGNSSAMTTALTEGKVSSGSLPVCERCFTRHVGPCTLKCHKYGKVRHKSRYFKEKSVATGANAQPIWTCYDCEEQGHMRNRCPKKVKQEETGEVRGRAYAINDAEPQGPNLVTSMFLLNNRYASVLFDSGSDRSFVDTRFSSMLKINPVKIDASYEVELADGRVRRYMENYKNVSQDIRDQLNAKAEAVQIIFFLHRGSMISTPQLMLVANACVMWKAIEVEKQGGLLCWGLFLGARENVGTLVMQKSGIQCYNCKEYGHVSRECQKPKRVKDAAYHKEKMLLCKQEEAGVQLNAEQADWKDDTDDESDDQELEAHYMYMAQIQEVTPDPVDNSGPIFDDEPMHKVQNNNDNYNVFAMENEHPEQPESSNDIYLAEQGDTNITIDSLDICYDRVQDDQDDTDDLDQERDLLASLIQKLKCEIDDSKNRNKILESSNKALGVNSNTIVLADHNLRAIELEDRVMPNNSQRKKKKVEDHRLDNPWWCLLRLEKLSIIVNQSVATSSKKTVATDPTVKKSRNISRKLYEKHMMGNLRLLTNFVEKFLGMVKFGNDQIAPILGYGDLVQGTITIKQGNDLLTGSRGMDSYSITLQDSTTPNPIVLYMILSQHVASHGYAS
ncbi:putative reverse transcriptase domain-containing protein [Tanacetum coccineum]